MRKPWPLFVFMVLLALSACAPQAVVTPTATQAPTTVSAAPTAAAGDPTQVQFQASGPATCTSRSGKAIEPNPTIAALFPPITEQDHILGPASAKMTIIEYSDFQ